jgi:hypothetical protein
MKNRDEINREWREHWEQRVDAEASRWRAAGVPSHAIQGMRTSMLAIVDLCVEARTTSAEERAFWDRCAATALGAIRQRHGTAIDDAEPSAAREADRMLEERRKRFHSGGAS